MLSSEFPAQEIQDDNPAVTGGTIDDPNDYTEPVTTENEYSRLAQNRHAMVCLLLRKAGLDAPEPGMVTVPTAVQMKNMQDMESIILRAKARDVKQNRQQSVRANTSRLMSSAAHQLGVVAQSTREPVHQPHSHHNR